MKMKNVVGFCAAAIAFAGFVQAQDLRRVTFIGTLNDYSPSTVSGGPWEMRGEWSLDLFGTANFSADFSMETSDYGITDSTQVDPTNPTTRSPHTHHVVMSNATVSYDTSSLPRQQTPVHGRRRDDHGHGYDLGERKPSTLREHGTVNPAGLYHWRIPSRILECYAGVHRTCNQSFRNASNPWRRQKDYRGVD